MRSFFLCCLLTTLFISFIFKDAHSCFDCPSNPCHKTTNRTFFSAHTKAGVNFNYEYYDFILIAEPLWSRNNLLKYMKENNIPERDRGKIPRPFKVLETLKGSINKNEIILKPALNNKRYEHIQRLDGGKKRNIKICYDSVHNKRDKNIEYLIFAKQLHTNEPPTIIRMSAISKNTLSPNKIEKSEMVFSGMLIETEDLPNATRIDTFEIFKAYKGIPEKTNIVSLRTKDTFRSSNWHHMIHDPRPYVIIHAFSAEQKDGVYNIEITPDIYSEITLLRKRRDQNLLIYYLF